MSAVLNPAPPILSGESPESYVRRLGLAHGMEDVGQFCRLLGLNYRSILTGSLPALKFLAELVGLPVAVVAADAITRIGDTYSYREQDLVGHSIRRDRVVACPACLRDDARTGRPAHGRGRWSITHTRTCTEHGLALVEMGRSACGRYGIDLTPVVAPALPAIEAMIAEADERPASGLEHYVEKRFCNGTTGASWIDTMPLHAAAKSCELLGAVAVFGPAQNLNLLTEDEWFRAGAVGFEIARGGPATIKAFLRELHHAPTAKLKTSNGPQAWFGRLYQVLAFSSGHPGFDPLREVIRDYLVDNTPVGTGEIIFGEPVATRRIHSIRTAFVETGVHPTRLRKILSKLGQIDVVGQMSDHEIHFDAVANADLLNRLKSALSFLDLVSYLNTNRIQVRLLIDEGFVRPVVEDADRDVGWEVFARRDVDDFLDRLLRRADPALNVSEGMLDIATAAKRSCCNSMEIVRGILDGDLQRIGRATDVSGYSAVLVDLDEVRAHVRGQELDGLTVDKAYRALKINPNAMKALIERGIIPITIQRHPVNRSPLRIVSQDALTQFNTTYVALFDAASSLKIHPVVLKQALQAMEVSPAFDPIITKATIYRRDQVPKFASEFDPELIAIKWPARQGERKRTS
ncbi:TniQ family protein [Bosea thiooxidans]|nr:TniQ family protein [Bosea sp. (in: a-proteobacteria)]